jgi:hypothetical protein
MSLFVFPPREGRYHLDDAHTGGVPPSPELRRSHKKNCEINDVQRCTFQGLEGSIRDVSGLRFTEKSLANILICNGFAVGSRAWH